MDENFVSPLDPGHFDADPDSTLSTLPDADPGPYPSSDDPLEPPDLTSAVTAAKLQEQIIPPPTIRVALRMLCRGYRRAEIARNLNVNIQTVARWINKYPVYIESLVKEIADASTFMAPLMPDAYEAIADTLTRPALDPATLSVRLKAAESVIDRTKGRAPQTQLIDHQATLRVVFEDADGRTVDMTQPQTQPQTPLLTPQTNGEPRTPNQQATPNDRSRDQENLAGSFEEDLDNSQVHDDPLSPVTLSWISPDIEAEVQMFDLLRQMG